MLYLVKNKILKVCEYFRDLKLRLNGPHLMLVIGLTAKGGGPMSLSISSLSDRYGVNRVVMELYHLTMMN